ncbi:pseudaminic acid biosynthesis-associated methylase [Ectothiorhodospira lacustris]|uniref:pseudaminic acid biosynthesis-associated methylase n=1 Tax=Ectothiorhodospira lacustris TaxID=2899127 RepID=UPI001EE811C3|nr:pseudaminic acid biosynthesis-associated methylase [Ectothiorhodospira lacustris]MCG5501465.1 hypothetical protein [Ectothiorhodospira lacustris]
MKKIEQDSFWAGDFGDNYLVRNNGVEMVSSNIALFSKVISRTNNINSVIEFGSNIGLNLTAIQSIIPSATISAVEINEKAIHELKKRMPEAEVFEGSILDYKPQKKHDLSFTKGLLIHIAPDQIKKAYETIYKSSKKYIFLAEYYNPTPLEVSYRGYSNKLFKRDFAGDMMNQFKDLKLVDYGFIYHRDSNFPQDDVTWFLLEKK